MGMHVGNDSAEDEGIVDMNTTPLIDVMLVLLIMLIVTIPLQTQSVAVDLPQGEPPAKIKPHPIETIGVSFDNQITWNGTTVTSEQDFLDRLKAAAAITGDNRPEIHIQPDRLASYKVVAHVLADTQRMGIDNLGIVGLEQYIDEQ